MRRQRVFPCSLSLSLSYVSLCVVELENLFCICRNENSLASALFLPDPFLGPLEQGRVAKETLVHRHEYLSHSLNLDP